MVETADYFVEFKDLVGLLKEAYPLLDLTPMTPPPSFLKYGGLLGVLLVQPQNILYHFKISDTGFWVASRKTYQRRLRVEWIGDAALGELHKVIIPEFRSMSYEVVR